jgi:hypothetical protein
MSLCVVFGFREMWTRPLIRACLLLALSVVFHAAPLSATIAAAAQDPAELGTEESASRRRGDTAADSPDWITQIQQLQHAMIRLPIAVGLASALALRPRRRGTPPRQAHVIQTQIILAIVGSVVMLVVGSSLARAFGIVGAAGLVRYRSKIEDPKDAGVMLSTLAIGLAAGVGVWMLAVFATGFILVFLWIVESAEPKVQQPFLLKVKVKDTGALKPQLEALLTRQRLPFELRTASQEELHYEVKMPFDKKTDRLSNAILDLVPDGAAVEWDEKKEKK